MKYSEERIRHLSHCILEELKKRNAVEFDDNTAALNEMKRRLLHYFKTEDEIDTFVRQKIRSYSRVIAEGSREWDVMYDKLFEEEVGKRGLFN